MLAGVTVPAPGLADAKLILNFVHTGHRFRHVFSHSFGVTVVDGPCQCDDTARNLDDDFGGIDIAMLGELIVDLLLNSLVGAAIAFRALSGEPSALAAELAATGLAGAPLAAILAAGLTAAPLAAFVLPATVLAPAELAGAILAAARLASELAAPILAAAELAADRRPAILVAALATAIPVAALAAAILTALASTTVLAAAVLAAAGLAASVLAASVLASSELPATGASAGFPFGVTTLAASAFTPVVAFASIPPFALVVAFIPALGPELAGGGLAIRALIAVALFLPAPISAIAFAASALPFLALTAGTAFVVLLIRHIKSFLNLWC